MKRLLTFLMALMLLAPAASAAETDSLQKHAVELAKTLDMLASSDAYLSAFTAEDRVLSLVAQWAAGSHDEAEQVYAADLSAFEQLTAEHLDALPDVIRQQQEWRIPQVLVQMAMNQEGVEAEAASAIAETSVSFAAQGVTGTGLYILTYENAWPVAVAWYANDNAVNMTATFLARSLQQQLSAKAGDAFQLEVGEVTIPCTVAEPVTAQVNTQYTAAPRLDQALLLARVLHSMAEDEAYHTILEVPEEVAEEIRGFVSAGYEAPRLAAEADTTVTVVVSGRVGVNADYDIVTVTEELNARRVRTALSEQVGRAGGAEMLAGVSSLHASCIFADKNARGTGMYVFVFEDALPIDALWAGNEGAYEVTAFFHPLDDLNGCTSISDINTWSDEIGLELEFEQISDTRLK